MEPLAQATAGALAPVATVARSTSSAEATGRLLAASPLLSSLRDGLQGLSLASGSSAGELGLSQASQSKASPQSSPSVPGTAAAGTINALARFPDVDTPILGHLRLGDAAPLALAVVSEDRGVSSARLAAAASSMELPLFSTCEPVPPFGDVSLGGRLAAVHLDRLHEPALHDPCPLYSLHSCDDTPMTETTEPQSVAFAASVASRASASTELPRPEPSFWTTVLLRPPGQPWWHGLVGSRIIREVSLVGDCYFRLPAAEPDDFASWFEHCEAVVRGVSGRCFYIGISERPAERWGDHARAGYVAMFVIAVAPSSNLTARLEQALIERFRGRRCQNIGRGGERRSAGSPHFVYVVFRDNELSRRSSGGSTRRLRLGTVMEDLYGPL